MKSFAILSFVTLRQDGSRSNRIIRNIGGQYRGPDKSPHNGTFYRLTSMLRHVLNYTIHSIRLIDNGSKTIYIVGDTCNTIRPIYSGGYSLDHYASNNQMLESIIGFQIYTNEATLRLLLDDKVDSRVKIKDMVELDDDVVSRGIRRAQPRRGNARVVSNVVELIASNSLSKDKLQPKDIKDEECLSINEVIDIIGELEGCGKDLINYVKKKIRK